MKILDIQNLEKKILTAYNTFKQKSAGAHKIIPMPCIPEDYILYLMFDYDCKEKEGGKLLSIEYHLLTESVFYCSGNQKFFGYYYPINLFLQQVPNWNVKRNRDDLKRKAREYFTAHKEVDMS